MRHASFVVTVGLFLVFLAAWRSSSPSEQEKQRSVMVGSSSAAPATIVTFPPLLLEAAQTRALKRVAPSPSSSSPSPPPKRTPDVKPTTVEPEAETPKNKAGNYAMCTLDSNRSLIQWTAVKASLKRSGQSASGVEVKSAWKGWELGAASFCFHGYGPVVSLGKTFDQPANEVLLKNEIQHDIVHVFKASSTELTGKEDGDLHWNPSAFVIVSELKRANLYHLMMRLIGRIALLQSNSALGQDAAAALVSLDPSAFAPWLGKSPIRSAEDFAEASKNCPLRSFFVNLLQDTWRTVSNLSTDFQPLPVIAAIATGRPTTNSSEVPPEVDAKSLGIYTSRMYCFKKTVWGMAPMRSKPGKKSAATDKQMKQAIASLRAVIRRRFPTSPSDDTAKSPIRITLVERLASRKLLGMRNEGFPALQTFCREQWQGNCTVSIENLEALPIEQQVGIVASTDVLLGMHGAALAWAPVMAEGSVIVEVSTPLYADAPVFGVNRNPKSTFGPLLRWADVEHFSVPCPDKLVVNRPSPETRPHLNDDISFPATAYAKVIKMILCRKEARTNKFLYSAPTTASCEKIPSEQDIWSS